MPCPPGERDRSSEAQTHVERWAATYPDRDAEGDASGPLELQILERRDVEPGDRGREQVVDARADARREAEVIHRRVDHLVVQDPLDLVERRLALLAVELLGLPPEEIVDLGKRAVRERTLPGHERLQARGGVSADPADRQHDAAQ